MLFSPWSACLGWSTHILQMCFLIIVKPFDSRLWRPMRNSMFLTNRCSYTLLLYTVPDPRHCLCALYQLALRCSMSLHSSVSSCPKLRVYNPNDFQWDENTGLKPPLTLFKEAALIPTLEFQAFALHPAVSEKTLSSVHQNIVLPSVFWTAGY